MSSATHDKELVEWLSRRGYQVIHPGDVSLVADLHGRERPADPGLAKRSLRVVPINERSPWTGDEPFYHLRGWGYNGGRQYQGLVVADGDRAVGSAVWYPLPDGLTAALAWIGLERQYRGLRFGSYLLDRGAGGDGEPGLPVRRSPPTHEGQPRNVRHVPPTAASRSSTIGSTWSKPER